MRADGNAIPYDEEDPSVREEYEAILAANEAVSRMEPEFICSCKGMRRSISGRAGPFVIRRSNGPHPPTSPRLSYKILVGDASDSPVVAVRGEDGQFSAGVSVLYSW